MGELNRHGHELVGLIAGEAEHEPLIPCAARVHAHGYIQGLALHRAHDRARVRVKAIFRSRVPDPANGFADKLVIIDVSVGGDLSGDHREARGDKRLARHAALRILPHHFIKHCVRDLIGDLVRVTFRHGLRSEQKILTLLARTDLSFVRCWNPGRIQPNAKVSFVMTLSD